MQRIVVMFVVLMLAAAPAAAKGPDWVGQYAVQGENADGSQYEGVVTVTANGETYDVIWEIAGDVFYGSGIAWGDRLSVGYDGGVAVYEIGDDGAVNGVWAETGGQSLGLETWR